MEGRDPGEALFTKTQRRVLGLLFGAPERSFYANEVVRSAGVGIGAALRESGVCPRGWTTGHLSWNRRVHLLLRQGASGDSAGSGSAPTHCEPGVSCGGRAARRHLVCLYSVRARIGHEVAVDRAGVIVACVRSCEL